MLYLTTRTKNDAFTSHRALCEDRSADGGLYTPFRLPAMDLGLLPDKSFGAVVSQILELFFTEKISFWDVEFCAGKRPARIVGVQQNVTYAQLWHRQSGSVLQLEQAIYGKITGTYSAVIPGWARIAIRIAFLFGIYAEMLKSGSDSLEPFDFAVSSTDSDGLLAAWYAKQMGLPIADILCGCTENSSLWNLLHFGEFRPQAGACLLPEELERLVFCNFGYEEAEKLVNAVYSGCIYYMEKDKLDLLRRSVDSSVVSEARVLSAISGIYRSSGFVASADAAMAYCALQDHRANLGGSRPTLIFTGFSPLQDGSVTARALGVTRSRLAELMR